MAVKVKWVRDPLFPSTQKPGVFPFSSSIDEFGVEFNTELWEEYNGVDDAQLNTFKFALGTWNVFSRRNRRIMVLTHEQANTLANRVTSDQAEEPKPPDPPPNFPPVGGDDSSTFGLFKSLENLNADEDSPSSGGTNSAGSHRSAAYNLSQDHWNGTAGNANSKDFNQGYDQVHEETHSTYGKIFKYKNQTGYAGPQPWIYDKSSIGDTTDDHLGGIGAWQIFERYRDTSGKNKHIMKFRPNLESEIWNDINRRGYRSPNQQWKWEPKNELTTDYDTGLQAFGEWIPTDFEGVIQFQTEPSVNNIYLGVVTSTKITSMEDITPEDLFIYHSVDSDAYQKNSAPVEVFFSLEFREKDPDWTGKCKYLILQWGDEKVSLTNEEILNTEFFEIYETEDDMYDKFTVKKLVQRLSTARDMYGEEITMPDDSQNSPERSEINSHIYTEPGVKTIKCIVFRFDSTEKYLVETTLVDTQIFIADPNEKIQDTSMFGSNNFSVLPIEHRNEFIFGSIDKRSEYAKSLNVIKINDLYESSDYLEKRYADKFLPNIESEIYGNYSGNIDLGLSRIFNKPYDIYDFIDADKLEWINFGSGSLPQDSSATEILISNDDCVVELNPFNINNSDIENTAKSSAKGVLIGDYALEKEKGEKIRKTDTMKLPEIEQKKDRQAF